MKILFIFRRFNDLDHIAPLADLIANNFDCKIYILSITDSIKISEIPIITYLKKNKNIRCGYLSEFHHNILLKTLFIILRKKKKDNFVSNLLIKIEEYFKKKFLGESWSDNLIKDLKISTLFLDFPFNQSHTYINLIKNSCNKKNIQIFGFHHAVWTRVLEYEGKIDEKLKKMFDQQKLLAKNYKKIIVGNKDFENNLQIKINNEKKFISLGSLRFTKKWQDKLFDIYKIKKNYDFKNFKKLKILYIDHSFKHGLDGKKIFHSLNKLLEIHDIDLTIKPNTSSDFKNQYDLSSEDLLSLEKFFSNKSTLNLINDNDVVINTFSSAAIDAYLLKKYLIIPKYFFSTYTQYQKYNSCIDINNELELIDCIKSLKFEKNYEIYKQENVQNFLFNVIYNNRVSEDQVYEDYKEFIKENVR